jgi:hypothetical protein
MKDGLGIILNFCKGSKTLQSIPNAVIDYIDHVSADDDGDFSGHPDCRRVDLPDWVAYPICVAAGINTSTPTRYGRGYVCADGLAYIDGRLDFQLTGD